MSALESLFVVPLGCDVAANAQSDDDGTHIRATLCGDRRAFGRLYTKYYGVVHGIILCRVPERDVDDAVQEVFAAALARLDSFEVGARFGPWLSTIARNHAIDRLRVRRRSVPFQEGLRPIPPQAFEVMAALYYLGLVDHNRR
ncbi:MAG: sigma-70 family RNA polymerase sigma factor [Myxococcota bacterium]